MTDWIDQITSAWCGHRKFAEFLVDHYKDPIVVELGVDYGFSTFVFANALNETNGKIYGIDLFLGDIHTGYRNTYDSVINNISEHNLKNIEIIVGDFTEISNKWETPIDILHIDGLHTYDAVKNDFNNWNKYLKDDGVIIFHDVSVPYFGVKHFFKEVTYGFKLYFIHSAGLGICTKNQILYNKILENFDNVYDDITCPFTD
uniref:Methyltransferase n=1 Tax=viral metagenome TaxID=1070528 RepID=A0A6C0CUD6_9ZZZZ